MSFNSYDHFLKVCEEERISPELAKQLLALAIRRNITIDDPIMMIVVLLGLFANASAQNSAALKSIPAAITRQIAAARDTIEKTAATASERTVSKVIQELRSDVVNAVRRRALQVHLVWLACAFGLAILCLTIAFNWGFASGNRVQERSDLLTSIVANSPYPKEWVAHIERNPAFPAQLNLCQPATAANGNKWCTIAVWVDPVPSAQLDPLLTQPLRALGDNIALGVVATGIALGLLAGGAVVFFGWLVSARSTS